MSEVAIHAADLAYSYDGRPAVDGVGFDVAPGEILGFLGPNGAGKSTTVKMFTGQLRPDRGVISILGMGFADQGREIQARIGVSFEEKNLYESMTGAENLSFHARLYGIKKLDAGAYLDRVGLGDRGDDRVSEYSKGMRQRLMMARALVNRPDVLFLDEPTAGLDPLSAQSIRRIIREEADRGVAVLLTTHDMHEADELSDRVAFINEGKLLVIDTPENLKLSHGRRSIRIRTRQDGQTAETVVPMDGDSAGEDLRNIIATEEVLTLHTEEASLEDIFVHFAGRGLA